MKSVLFLSCCLFSLASFAQSEPARFPAGSGPAQPFSFKGCNTIIVQAKDSSSALFNRFLTHLEDQGYVVEQNDKERMTFATNSKRYKKNLNPTMTIKGYIRGNRIFLSGFMKSPTLVGRDEEASVVDKGMVGSPMKEAFVSMDHTAGLFSNSERFYLLR